MSKITDHFKVGDRVKWVRVSREPDGVKIHDYNGEIKEIIGSKAAIDSPEFQGLVMVSLFELEVITNEKAV